MPSNSRFWYLVSILCFVGAVWFWLKGNEVAARRKAERAPAAVPEPGSSPSATRQSPASGTLTGKSATVVSPAVVVPSPGGAAPPPKPSAAGPQGRFPYRLSNTDKSLDQLGRSDTAILLDNAFIDTANRTPLEVPEHLRARGDPGSYIVQSARPLDGTYYGSLRQAGAEFVSYIPNNAGLVRVTATGARQLAGLPGIRAVLPYEPYFKLAQPLLPTAVEKESLPLDGSLNVTLFPGGQDKVRAALRDLGAEVIREERTPFGPLLTIRPHPDSLQALAQLTEVQHIEYAHGRTLLNDLSRVHLHVAPDTITASNYLDLTGTNVTLNLNDTGVDSGHSDLSGRVSSADPGSLLDTNGHGTHVAGTIIGSGGLSGTALDVNGDPPAGSVVGADFRGMAPGASLYVLPVDLATGPLISDEYLQETAASNNFVGPRTNPLISNNSWGYLNAFEYNSASASYDAAVRDALPGVTGSQPILYVFAAGNSGFGSTNGTVGEPDSILAPATAKNVITVGALESFRNITNEFYTTNVVSGTNVISTNAPFVGFTDSDNEVAAFSSRGNVGIGTEGDFGRFKPDVVAPGTFVVSTRSGYMDPNNLNALVPDLGLDYRYESGTSMAAGGVSGLLALMQEFFEQKLKRGFSPALFKALLINGSRSVNGNYDRCVTNVVTFQGWGLVNLTNSLPAALTNSDQAGWPIRFFDQNPTNAIATGQQHTWNVALIADAQLVPLRVTLVWTDPPGNPGSGIKLVNDLDLVVTNLDTGRVFFGNNIPSGLDFNQPREGNDTNSAPVFDFVNNVENVLLEPPLGTNYSINVIGRRVNVNAVTANTTDIVQDYALVISSGDGELTNAFVSVTRANDGRISQPAPIGLTNGAPLLKQRVGANFQLSPSTNGEVSQWRFYVFTNAFFTNNFTGLTNGSNLAFITFFPPDLSRPRNLDADIDLYVSRDAALLNLDAAAITAASKSLNRGGTELVVFTNALVGLDQVYYLGVKSEDQQGAEFGVVGLSTDLPFDEAGDNGARIIRGLPPSVEIPDGSPDAPGGALMFAIGIQPLPIGRVIVTNDITHQSVGDLLGNLSHQEQFAVLNNHNRYNNLTNGFFHLVYDDSGSGRYFFSRFTDGPGSLNRFVGERSAGVWLLTMTDDARGRTGRVESLTLRVEPQILLTNGVDGSVLANQWVYYFVDVPTDASKLTVTLSQISPALPLNLYLKRDAQPTTADFDKSALINPSGGNLSIGLGDVPPLNAGRYFIGIFNPNSVTVSFHLTADLERNLAALATGNFLSVDTPFPLLDDAITRSSIFVPITRQVAEVHAGVRIDHQRASDLVLHLVSPQGTRVLLTENRGGTNRLGYGNSDLLSTNTVTVLTNNFESAAPGDYFAGDVVDGWRVASNAVSIRADRTVAAEGTNLLVLRGGRLSRNLPTIAGRSYRLNFAYRLNPGVPRGIVGWWPLVGDTASDIIGAHTGFMSEVAIVPGVVDGAFGFNGTNSLISVPDVPALDFTADFTLEFWVNPDPVQNPFASILRKEDPLSPNGFGIEMDGAADSNLYYAGWKNSGSAPGEECWTTAPFQLTPGIWQHVAVVKTNATRLVYINGTPVGSATCVGTTNTVAVNNAPLQFGIWSGRTNAAWKGVLDEMAVYNRALTPAEIGDIVVADSAGKCGNLIPPVTCSAGTTVLIDGSPLDVVPGNFSWVTRSVQFSATKNGAVLELAPIGAGLLLDNFVLTETQINSRPLYTVFTDNTNLTTVLVKFATAPFTNGAAMTSITNRFVVNDGFENSSTGIFSGGQFVSGWQVSTGQVQVFGIPNPLGKTEITNGWPPVYPGTKFLVLNGGWDSNDIITNWVPGGIVTNFSTTVNGPYTLSFVTAADPTPFVNVPPPGYPTNPPVVSVLINGALVTNVPVTAAIWRTNTLAFQATQPVTSLELRSFTTNGVLLDVVQVTGLSNDREAYVLPEESLKPFVGESAFGDWTLEVWDNRIGAALAQLPPFVLNWKLDFIFANTNPPAIPLTFCPATTNVASVYDTNCAPVTNTVSGGEIKYFIVDVPRRATRATNILSGTGDLVLLYNRDGLPSGAVGDLAVNSNGLNAGETLLLTTNTPAGFELRPGQRYYLGVTNVNPAASDTFTISVAFDQTDTNLVSVTALTNGICLTNTIPATNALDYYQFTVSSNASTVTFQLSPQNGNADLVVRRALPVPDPLPTPYAGRFDYISQNPSNAVDTIVVSLPSQPVPLSPGVWYLGVFNVAPNPVTYSICATESTGLPNNIIRLTNNVPLDFQIKAGSPLTNFFLFTIDQTNASVTYSLYNLNNPAELLVNLDAFPDPANFLFNGSGSMGQPVQIPVDTNGFLSELNGNWFLAVENLSTNDLNFTILASLSTNSLPPPPTNVVVINPQLTITNNMFCLAWNSVVGRNYHVEGKTNLTDSTWIVISPTITAIDTTTTYCVPLTTPQGFFRVIEESAPPPPPPGGPVINPQLVITNGTMCLTWDSVVGRNYHVEVKTNLTDAVWIVISPTITATNTTTTSCVPLGTAQGFYRVVEESAPPPPPPGGPVINPQLVITNGTMCLTWDSVVGRNYHVEVKTNLTDAVWIVISPTITATNTTTTYCVPLGTAQGFYRVVEESAPPPPPPGGPVISPQLVVTNGTICLTWDSAIGTEYYVEENTNVAGVAWTIISPTITATNTTTTYCVPVSGSLQFFRIVQGTAPAATLPLISFSSLTLTPGGFVLNWTAPATNQFKVQYATNLPPSWMTFTNIIASTNGNFTFTDDGTQGGPLTALRFYRLILLP